MDTGSLDAAVQGALRALYPPFEATAPTVLGQVFRLLETSYQGDGLCCLLQFLIPAKRLFEHVRQAACAPYFNCIFLHEGWPLCLHEKVVVHLAPLNPLLLRPGDFYLQAEPCEEHSARITVKHLSGDLRTVEETPVPEAAYALLFTNEWLEEINGARPGAPLRTCLVATENGVAPLPWSAVATPEFVHEPQGDGTQQDPAPETTAEPAAPGVPTPRGVPGLPLPYGNVAGTIPGCKVASRKPGRGRYPGLIKVDQAGPRKKLAMPSLSEIVSQNMEGEYVNLLEQSQDQLDLLARSLPPARPTGAGTEVLLPWAIGGPGADAWTCGGALSSEEGPCTPCLGRKLSQEPGPHGPRCRQRDSYLAALQNPVSFGPGLMAAILEEPDGPELPPATSCGTPVQHGVGAASPTLLTHRPQRAGPGVPAEASAQQGSSRVPSGSGHKFSFLKGPRLGAAPGDERATSQHEGAWKKMSALYSPRMSRAKPARKGTNVAAAAPAEEGSMESTSCKNGPSVPSSSTLGQEPPAWQDLHTELLCSGIMCLPGSSDRLGRALLQVTTSGSAWGATWCSSAELAKLILYLCSLPRREAKDSGLTVVLDARKQPPSPVLLSALRSVQNISPGCIHTLLLLAEKELVVHRERLPGVQVETLASLKALGRFIDSSQLTQELDGTFPYCHGEWVQFFQKLHPFTADLRRASELLRSCIQELRGTEALAGMQDVAGRIERHQELMRGLLSDPQLVRVQREGGAVLARLRREGTRLGTSAHVRASMELAEGLYSQLEEQLHDLVSQSNSCLERLEFLQKVQDLMTKFSKLGCWLDGEAAARLQEMGAEESTPDSSDEQFNEFLVQATARYRHGLVLCQEAAEVRDVAFPEANPFQAAAALLRTKLMSFSRQVERRQAEQELLRELGCFSSKVAGLELGCWQHSAWAKLGEGQALQGLQSSFQKLSVELALEKLQEMKAQVRRMRSSRGLAAWTEARHRYQESRQILEEMLAELQEAWGAQADGQGDAFNALGSAAPHQEAPICKAAASPKPVVSGSQGVAEQLVPNAEGPGQPQGPGQPPAHSPPGPTLGTDLSSSQPWCQQQLEGDGVFHRRGSVDTSLPKPKSRACLGAAGHLTQDHSQRHHFTLPPRARSLGAEPLCPTAVPHGTAQAPGTLGPPLGKPAETTQYFQVSSQSSFSSEDSDSQNSTEEVPAARLALPRDLHSPRPPCPSEKPPQIVYLENHHTEGPAKAGAK